MTIKQLEKAISKLEKSEVKFGHDEKRAAKIAAFKKELETR